MKGHKVITKNYKFVAASDKRSKVGMGVAAGDPAYGNERPARRSQWGRPQIREEVRPNAEEKAVTFSGK